MTQTPTAQPITQHVGPVPPTGYPVAPIPNIAAGVLASIPYPTNLPRQTVPIQLRHCVVANSSPFTLLVTQGANLTQIPAFTADDVRVIEAGQGAPITVLPQATGALVAAGTDATLYPTWYDTDPPGVYPCAIGAGSIPLSQATNILTLPITSPTATINQPITVPTWAQAISVRVDWSGAPANAGLLMTMTDTASGTTFLTGVTFYPSQVFYLPVNGRNVTLNISTLLQGASGGTMTGTMYVNALTGPITVPVLGSLNTTAASNPQLGTQMGLVASGVQATVGQSLLVTRAATGFVLRLHTINMWMNVAPAATQQMAVRGGQSGLNYATWYPPTTLPCNVHMPMNGAMVGANSVAGNFDGNESLQLVNNSSQQLNCSVTYDVIPTPYA